MNLLTDYAKILTISLLISTSVNAQDSTYYRPIKEDSISIVYENKLRELGIRCQRCEERANTRIFLGTFLLVINILTTTFLIKRL